MNVFACRFIYLAALAYGVSMLMPDKFQESHQLVGGLNEQSRMWMAVLGGAQIVISFTFMAVAQLPHASQRKVLQYSILSSSINGYICHQYIIPVIGNDLMRLVAQAVTLSVPVLAFLGAYASGGSHAKKN